VLETARADNEKLTNDAVAHCDNMFSAYSRIIIDVLVLITIFIFRYNDQKLPIVIGVIGAIVFY